MLSKRFYESGKSESSGKFEAVKKAVKELLQQLFAPKIKIKFIYKGFKGFKGFFALNIARFTCNTRSLYVRKPAISFDISSALLRFPALMHSLNSFVNFSTLFDSLLFGIIFSLSALRQKTKGNIKFSTNYKISIHETYSLSSLIKPLIFC